MANINILEAEIYVGTYKKYTNGSLDGKWLYLKDYDSKEAFIKACADLHKDESDPEYMFQDKCYIPESMFNESHLSPEFWKLLEVAKELNEEERTAFNIWVNLKEYDIEDYIQKGYDIKDRFMDSWRGKHESLEHYYIDFLDESGYFDRIPNTEMRDEIERYFDFVGYARDKELNDYIEFDDGQVFINLDRGSN